MVNNEEALVIGAGALGGVGVPFLVRHFFDTDKTTGQVRQFIPQLGAYGTPSALVGIGTGAAGIAVGMFGNKLGVRDNRIRTAAFAYGVSALASGLVSGFDPVQAIPATAAHARVVSSAAASAPAMAQPRAAPSASAAPATPTAAITYRKPRTY